MAARDSSSFPPISASRSRSATPGSTAARSATSRRTRTWRYSWRSTRSWARYISARATIRPGRRGSIYFWAERSDPENFPVQYPGLKDAALGELFHFLEYQRRLVADARIFMAARHVLK